MVCKTCKGVGTLGFRKENCFECLGSGYIKEKIRIRKEIVEEGLEKLIEEQLKIIRKLDIGFASDEAECEERLKLLREKRYNENILELLGVGRGYIMADYGGIKVE